MNAMGSADDRLKTNARRMLESIDLKFCASEFTGDRRAYATYAPMILHLMMDRTGKRMYSIPSRPQEADECRRVESGIRVGVRRLCPAYDDMIMPCYQRFVADGMENADYVSAFSYAQNVLADAASGSSTLLDILRNVESMADTDGDSALPAGGAMTADESKDWRRMVFERMLGGCFTADPSSLSSTDLVKMMGFHWKHAVSDRSLDGHLRRIPERDAEWVSRILSPSWFMQTRELEQAGFGPAIDLAMATWPGDDFNEAGEMVLAAIQRVRTLAGDAVACRPMDWETLSALEDALGHDRLDKPSISLLGMPMPAAAISDNDNRTREPTGLQSSDDMRTLLDYGLRFGTVMRSIAGDDEGTRRMASMMTDAIMSLRYPPRKEHDSQDDDGMRPCKDDDLQRGAYGHGVRVLYEYARICGCLKRGRRGAAYWYALGLISALRKEMREENPDTGEKHHRSDSGRDWHIHFWPQADGRMIRDLAEGYLEGMPMQFLMESMKADSAAFKSDGEDDMGMVFMIGIEGGGVYVCGGDAWALSGSMPPLVRMRDWIRRRAMRMVFGMRTKATRDASRIYVV